MLMIQASRAEYDLRVETLSFKPWQKYAMLKSSS